MDEIWGYKLLKLGKFVLTTGKVIEVLLIICATWLALTLFKKYLIHKKQQTQGERGRRLSLYQLVRYFVWVSVVSTCITILGFDGRVVAINLRTSELLTRDGYNIIVPNHKFITENVINWSHNSFDRRFQIQIGISYNSDIDQVTRILLECASTQKELINENDHKPSVRFQDFGDSALVFLLMFWTSDIFPVEQVKSEMRYKIFKAFKAENITMPFPQIDVHVFNPGL